MLQCPDYTNYHHWLPGFSHHYSDIFMPNTICGTLLTVYKHMKQVTLLHNPQAGDETHGKKELKSLLKGNGFGCRYFSTKDRGWKDFTTADLLAIAGGDGTVRKAIKSLLKRKNEIRLCPIAMIPLGTANNIASTLGISGSPGEIIASWKNNIVQKFDLGRIHNLDEATFFLEGFGIGIFPWLMKKMRERDNNKSSEEKLNEDLQLLREIIHSYEPVHCKIEVDGTDHSGKFILAEIMNTKSIGPGLVLSPHADPGDGELEVILIPESHKQKFADYLENKMNGTEETYHYHTLKAKNISISWQSNDVHVDDEIFDMEELREAEIEVKAGVLEFLVPAQKTTVEKKTVSSSKDKL